MIAPSTTGPSTVANIHIGCVSNIGVSFNTEMGSFGTLFRMFRPDAEQVTRSLVGLTEKRAGARHAQE